MIELSSFAPTGFDGVIVRVEVDIRRGIPGLDIVGLPDAAIRESRERIRVAVRNSRFQFPRDRVLVNLAPGDVRKAGTHFDLPIAVAVLGAANGVSGLVEGISLHKTLIVGELDLAGAVHGVRGVLPAVALGLERGFTRFLVPVENAPEAAALGRGVVVPVGSIQKAISALSSRKSIPSSLNERELKSNRIDPAGADLDFGDMSGAERIKRALLVAVSGRHHALLFGPPGSGKTMASTRIGSILPSLSRDDAITVTKIHSIAGTLGNSAGLIRSPPVRAPHHTATIEGLIGGGRDLSPGEVSLAHRGVLLLDEACEFRPSILQSLREPVEASRVTIVRAGAHLCYPADIQLVMSSNSCPCGNTGREDESCLCSRREIQQYWKRLGGPLLDRIDIRLQTEPLPTGELLSQSRLSSSDMRLQIEVARKRQAYRFSGSVFRWNKDIPSSRMREWCPMTKRGEATLVDASGRATMSARSHIAAMRLARTIADVEDCDLIEESHMNEAISLRRYGDGDLYWR